MCDAFILCSGISKEVFRPFILTTCNFSQSDKIYENESDCYTTKFILNCDWSKTALFQRKLFVIFNFNMILVLFCWKILSNNPTGKRMECLVPSKDEGYGWMMHFCSVTESFLSFVPFPDRLFPKYKLNFARYLYCNALWVMRQN